ncbi:bifunctional oligoribonuclease/PAP phosphatase NrnA [Candidatus Berkelbacteria bacterium]|nr:bifunctional oligoribonuclease/PAP phosphatase NrnA [Candidatus Berkelbacteria bacterium]
MISLVSNTLRAAERLLLITHEQADGDAAGSLLALGHTLRRLGKNVTLTCVDEIPHPFRFLPGVNLIQRDCLLGSYDRIVIIDCGDLKRTGLAHRIREFTRFRQRIINIDHHQRNDLHKLASLNYVDSNASSAAELIFPLIKALDINLDADIATCLLTGLYNDTGGFKHSNTSPIVLSQAAELMARGARLDLINANVASFKSVPALRLWGVALSRIKYHPSLKIVTSIITEEDLATCNAYHEDLAGCVNLINCVPEARATILLCELPNGRIKASVRTEDDAVNVAALANLFGGGGIRKAAGFSFSGKFLRSSLGWQIVHVAPSLLTLPLRLGQPTPVAA